MARIIVDQSGRFADIGEAFVGALSLLCEGGFKPRAGTKLVSKYAVIVVDEEQTSAAIDRLRAGNFGAVWDP